jgi:hypothetical protein
LPCEIGRNIREREMRLVRRDVNEPPRDFGKHVELCGRALELDQICGRARGRDARGTLSAELEHVRQRKGGFGRIESARASRAECVLDVDQQVERRAQRRFLFAGVLCAQPKHEALQVGIAAERSLDGFRERQRRAGSYELLSGADRADRRTAHDDRRAHQSFQHVGLSINSRR